MPGKQMVNPAMEIKKNRRLRVVNRNNGDKADSIRIPKFGKAFICFVEELERRVFLSTANTSLFLDQQTFSIGTSTVATRLVMSDLNGDGQPDVIIANDVTPGDVIVMLGNGDGSFQAPATFSTGNKPYGVAVADLNGDGRADLLVANHDSNSVGILLGNGNGTFAPQTTVLAGSGPSSITADDVNGDGRLDLLLVNSGDQTVGAMLGNGNGTFQPQQTFVTGSGAFFIAVSDVNGDGKLDVAVSDNHTIGLLLGNGNGTFQSQRLFTAGIEPGTITITDLNADGKPDLITANSMDNTVSVLLGNGDATFKPQQTFATGFEPISLAASDVNGDGNIDLVTANIFANTLSVLLGNGDGTFQTQLTFAAGAAPDTVALTDANQDGRPDIIVDNQTSQTISVLLTHTARVALEPVPATASAGDPITLTATVTASTTAPTGTVTFYDGQIPIGTVPVLSNSSAILAGLSSLSPGTHAITAWYNGDSLFQSIHSASQSILITPRSSSLQTTVSGKIPTAPLISGKKFKPIHLGFTLSNSISSTAAGNVSVQLTFSTSADGTSDSTPIKTLARKVKIKGHKKTSLGAITVKTLPPGLSGTVYLVVHLTDTTGAVSTQSIGQISILPAQ
jgi:hypothetical protein